MTSIRRRLLATAAIALLSGCATPHPPPPAPPPEARVDVNVGYRSGRLEGPVRETPPTLEALQNAVPQVKELDDPEDKLRIPAMRDAALSYGARGGLAFTSKQINDMLRSRSPELNRIYDFSSMIMRGPSDSMILPPVISEARDSLELIEANKTLRAADQVYEIVEQARFVPVVPLWQTYLAREWSPPTAPPDAVLPKTDGERDLWRRLVAEGWMQGVKQAQEIFQLDMNRLDRDYTGMVRYKTLLEQGMVSNPVVAEGNLGVTGDSERMRINDRAIRITRDPGLQLDPRAWTVRTSPVGPREASTPPRSAPQMPRKVDFGGSSPVPAQQTQAAPVSLQNPVPNANPGIDQGPAVTPRQEETGGTPAVRRF
jgi:defect-in-organelle-trafficking protein DotC